MIVNQKARKIKLKQTHGYVKESVGKGIYPSYKELQQKFNIRHYKITLVDVYSKLDISLLEAPIHKSKNCQKILRNELIGHIKKEVSKGHYPSGVDIGNKFGVKHIWNFVTMTELYNRLGLPAYHKRRKRGPRH